MVVVYAHWVIDTERAQAIVAPHKRTAEAIVRLPGGIVIPETAEDVAADLVDGEGRYMPEWRGK